jgi:hypothetical protein
MTKFQFWTLNVIGLVLVAQLLGHHFFARQNDRLGDAVLRDQAFVNGSRQVEVTLDQLAKRTSPKARKPTRDSNKCPSSTV